MQRMSERKTVRRLKAQRGSTLLVALMVLAVLSLLGVTFMSLAITETSITANLLGVGSAFQAAEAGFHDGISRGIIITAVTPAPRVATLYGARPAFQASYTFPAALQPGEQVLVPLNNITNCDEIGSNCKKGIPVLITATGNAGVARSTVQGQVTHICALC